MSDIFNQIGSYISKYGYKLLLCVCIIAAGICMSDQEYNEAYDKLAKDLSKALVVAKEIEDAKELAMKNSFIANENNIVKVEGEKKPKKSKRK